MGWEGMAQGFILNLMDSGNPLGAFDCRGWFIHLVVIWGGLGVGEGGVLRTMELRMGSSLHWDMA